MRVLIVEDEMAAADNLTYLLRKIDSSIEVTGYSESVEQTVDLLRETSGIDLIFMDIHLSDGSAFSIFDIIKVDIPIVFTTAYDQYALDAFKVNSIDYLLKPIKTEDLCRALDKFRMRTPQDLMAYVSSMYELAHRREYASRLLVPVRDKIIPVVVNDICYLYSTNRQTVIVLADGTRVPINKSLEQIYASLDHAMFTRANKQYIVAKDRIVELTTWFDSRLVVKMSVDTPEPVFISKNSASDFKRWLSV